MAAVDLSEEDIVLLRALNHEMRRKVLVRVSEVGTASPNQLARYFEHPLTNLAYHVRGLADCGALELVGTTPVRGSLEHRYRISLERPWAVQLLGIELETDKLG